MKTILLKFADVRHETKPQRYNVDFVDSEGRIHVNQVIKFSDGSGHTDHYVLTPRPDGTLVNQNGCAFVKVKPDLRKKPFSVESREEGRGPKTVHKFATMLDLQIYVKGRWQGWDYYDGDNSFHNDYATFVVIGADLKDVVPAREESFEDTRSEDQIEYAMDTEMLLDAQEKGSGSGDLERD